jgi:hypothetical protein
MTSKEVATVYFEYKKLPIENKMLYTNIHPKTIQIIPVGTSHASLLPQY